MVDSRNSGRDLEEFKVEDEQDGDGKAPYVFTHHPAQSLIFHKGSAGLVQRNAKSATKKPIIMLETMKHESAIKPSN